MGSEQQQRKPTVIPAAPSEAGWTDRALVPGVGQSPHCQTSLWWWDRPRSSGELNLQVRMGSGDGNRGLTQSRIARQLQGQARKAVHGSGTSSTAPVAALEIGAPRRQSRQGRSVPGWAWIDLQDHGQKGWVEAPVRLVRVIKAC